MRTFLKNMGVTAITLVLLFLVSEIVTRLTTPPVSRENVTHLPTDLIDAPRYGGVPFVLRPLTEATQSFGTDPRGYFDPGATLTYRTNNLGFRGPDVEPKKPEGTLRLLGLGDSFTFGTGVRFEDTFLSQLQRMLDERREGRPVQVINMGVPSYSTYNEVSTLLAYVRTLTPDIVVICFFLNDNGDVPDIMDPINPKGHPWYRASRFLDHLIWRWERRKGSAALVASFYKSFEDQSEGWNRTKDSFGALRTYSRQFDFQPVVMLFPVLWHLSDNYPFEQLHAKVCNYVDSLGIPCLDLLPKFAGHDGPELWVHPNNQHPNEKAHAIAAEALYHFLDDRHMLEREPTAPAGSVPQPMH
jgi:lysophospholipase L1-like esterase